MIKSVGNPSALPHFPRLSETVGIILFILRRDYSFNEGIAVCIYTKNENFTVVRTVGSKEN